MVLSAGVLDVEYAVLKSNQHNSWYGEEIRRDCIRAAKCQFVVSYSTIDCAEVDERLRMSR